MKIRSLEWDSQFFRKMIGEIDFDDENESTIDTGNFDLIYLKQSKDVFFEIDNFKNCYTETKIIFSKEISEKLNVEDNLIFSAFDIEIDIEQIYQLAFESGKFSRFKLDDNFQQYEFEGLYKTWVDNSLSKEIADAVLVFKEQNNILGFITYKIFENYVTIGLTAVCASYQGKGIGKKLLESVENELSKKHIKELRIPTQLQNKQACKFYKKSGFNIVEETIIKHYWKL